MDADPGWLKTLQPAATDFRIILIDPHVTGMGEWGEWKVLTYNDIVMRGILRGKLEKEEERTRQQEAAKALERQKEEEKAREKARQNEVAKAHVRHLRWLQEQNALAQGDKRTMKTVKECQEEADKGYLWRCHQDPMYPKRLEEARARHREKKRPPYIGELRAIETTRSEASSSDEWVLVEKTRRPLP